jgi:hypothetical protein
VRMGLSMSLSRCPLVRGVRRSRCRYRIYEVFAGKQSHLCLSRRHLHREPSGIILPGDVLVPTCVYCTLCVC